MVAPMVSARVLRPTPHAGRDTRARARRGLAAVALAIVVLAAVAPAAGARAGAARGASGPRPAPGARAATLLTGPVATADAVALAVPSVAPPGASELPVDWFTVSLRDGAVIAAAVARPPQGVPSSGPPVVVLPGTDGLRRRYVELARGFARAGRVAVVGCWFAPGLPFDADTIPCPTAPPFAGATTAGVPAVDGLIALARNASGDPGPVVLVGHSRGATMALLAAAHDDAGAIGAVVASAAIYSAHLAPGDVDELPVAVADQVRVPVLALHGTADPLVPVDQARAWAWASAGHPERAEHELVGGSHALPFDASSAPWWASEVLGFLALLG
jgi:dienelactone hydrolase